MDNINTSTTENNANSVITKTNNRTTIENEDTNKEDTNKLFRELIDKFMKQFASRFGKRVLEYKFKQVFDDTNELS